MIQTASSGATGTLARRRRGITIASAGSAGPASIAGLAAWFKADALGLSDGTAVSSWTDSSGNARHATQATGAAQPLYKTAIVNGQPVIRFDGTDDFLDCSGITANTAARTLFIVGKQASAVSFAGMVNLGKAASATGGLAPIASVWNYFHNQATAAVSLGGSAAAFAQIHVRWNSTASCDGFVGAGAATNFDPIDTYSTAATDLFIGSWDGSATIGPFFNGDIAEVIIYNAALSEGDRTTVRSYLTSKYGV